MRFSGLAIIYWQAFIDNLDRPSILVLAGGMLGAPSFIKLIQKRNGNGGNGGAKP